MSHWDDIQYLWSTAAAAKKVVVEVKQRVRILFRNSALGEILFSVPSLIAVEKSSSGDLIARWPVSDGEYTRACISSCSSCSKGNLL